MDLLYRIVDQVLAGDPQILLLFLTFSSIMLLVLGGVGLVVARDRVAQRLQDGANASPGITESKVTLRVGEHESLLHSTHRSKTCSMVAVAPADSQINVSICG